MRTSLGCLSATMVVQAIKLTGLAAGTLGNSIRFDLRGRCERRRSAALSSPAPAFARNCDALNCAGALRRRSAASLPHQRMTRPGGPLPLASPTATMGGSLSISISSQPGSADSHHALTPQPAGALLSSRCHCSYPSRLAAHGNQRPGLSPANSIDWPSPVTRCKPLRAHISKRCYSRDRTGAAA
jgi:hypothetical protein